MPFVDAPQETYRLVTTYYHTYAWRFWKPLEELYGVSVHLYHGNLIYVFSSGVLLALHIERAVKLD